MNENMNKQTFSPGRPARPCSPTSPWRQNNRHPIIFRSHLRRWLSFPPAPHSHSTCGPQLWILGHERRIGSQPAPYAADSTRQLGLWKPSLWHFQREGAPHSCTSSLSPPQRNICWNRADPGHTAESIHPEPTSVRSATATGQSCDSKVHPAPSR